MSIVKGSNQVESQSQPLAAVAIGAAQNAESLEPTNNVLNQQSLTRQLLVFLLLIWRQWMMFALFVGRARIFMLFLQAFVAAIAQTAGHVLKRQRTGFKQGKVMHAAGTKGGSYNAIVGLLDYHLRFMRVSLFLAAVVAPLLFLGRCTGISVASTTTTSKANCGSCKAFLPGRVNAPQASNALSTWRIVRHTVGSETAYATAMWAWLRYSRQYISVISKRSAAHNLQGRPRCPLVSGTQANICSNTLGFTPVRRWNASGLRSLI